jgi:hypothetical protein
MTIIMDPDPSNNLIFCLDSGDHSDDSEDEGEAPVVLRRKKVYVKRKDRAVRDVKTAQDPASYVRIDPPTEIYRQVFRFNSGFVDI